MVRYSGLDVVKHGFDSAPDPTEEMEAFKRIYAAFIIYYQCFFWPLEQPLLFLSGCIFNSGIRDASMVFTP
jgi:hypothetical protein